MVVGPPPCLISGGSISSTFFFGHSYRKEENLNLRHSQMAIKNKQVRKLQNIKRKRTESAAKHKLRHERRKEETKNPSLRAERLARSVPLTLDVSSSH